MKLVIRAREHRKAFTLLEIMVAVAILAVVTTLVWGSFKGTFSAKTKVESAASRVRTVRLALNRMALDASMAYLSMNEDRSLPERRTKFIGKHHADIDELSFSYMGHQRLYADAKESDTAQVIYYGARDRNDSRKMNLMRRETRRLSNLKPEEAANESDVLCDDVISLHFNYFDNSSAKKAWVDNWNSTTDQADRLPSKIKITLTVRDERGREVPFMTETRLMVSEPISLSPSNLPANATPFPVPASGVPSGTSRTPTPDPNRRNP